MKPSYGSRLTTKLPGTLVTGAWERLAAPHCMGPLPALYKAFTCSNHCLLLGKPKQGMRWEAKINESLLPPCLTPFPLQPLQGTCRDSHGLIKHQLTLHHHLSLPPMAAACDGTDQITPPHPCDGVMNLKPWQI